LQVIALDLLWIKVGLKVWAEELLTWGWWVKAWGSTPQWGKAQSCSGLLGHQKLGVTLLSRQKHSVSQREVRPWEKSYTLPLLFGTQWKGRALPVGWWLDISFLICKVVWCHRAWYQMLVCPLWMFSYLYSKSTLWDSYHYTSANLGKLSLRLNLLKIA
jgi:hypothetical protein